MQAVVRGSDGAFLTADTVLITDDAPVLLTSLGPVLDEIR